MPSRVHRAFVSSRLGLVPLVLAGLAAVPAAAQLEEIFSRHVRVQNPIGGFAAQLVKLAPGSGPDWQTVEEGKDGFRIEVPEGATLDATASGSRLLLLTFGEAGGKSRPTLRIDRFTPEKGEPTDTDVEYVEAYARAYPERAFGGKFSVTDQGLLTLRRKHRLAMIGGVHAVGTTDHYRLQCAYLSKTRQYFLTFDGTLSEWSRLSDMVGRTLLSFDPAAK